MAQQNRVPLQVSPKFKEKLEELQRKIMMKGKQKSLRALTEDIANTVAFEEFEKQLLQNDNINLDIQIRMDRRRT